MQEENESAVCPIGHKSVARSQERDHISADHPGYRLGWSASSEKSEHLGLVVPSAGGVVTGRTFSHFIPVAVYDALANAGLGATFTYRSGDDSEWTATVTTISEVMFESQQQNSFRVRREHLL